MPYCDKVKYRCLSAFLTDPRTILHGTSLRENARYKSHYRLSAQRTAIACLFVCLAVYVYYASLVQSNANNANAQSNDSRVYKQQAQHLPRQAPAMENKAASCFAFMRALRDDGDQLPAISLCYMCDSLNPRGGSHDTLGIAPISTTSSPPPPSNPH